MQANLIASLRLVRVFWHVCTGGTLALVYRLTHGDEWYLKPMAIALRRWWMQKMARLTGIKIAQYGRATQPICLYVANHVSFLDIIVIASLTDVRFLSKQAVRNWPLIGFMASISGTLFIERGKRSLIARIITAIGKALQDSSIVIFPEGTTSLGESVKKFHSGLFQAAIDSQVPVQPVSLRYIRDGQPDRVAAYIDDDHFLATLWRMLKQTETIVHVRFIPGIHPANPDRQTLAQECQEKIEHSLHANLLVSVR